MDNMSDMVFVMKVNGQGSFIYEYLNGAARKRIDYEANVIGKTLQEVNSKEVITTLYKNYQYVVDNQTKLTYKDSYINKQGKINYSETKLTPLFSSDNTCTHIVAMIKDITNEVNITNQLEIPEENLYIIANYTRDIITLIDPSEKVIYASPTYEKMLGFNQTDFWAKNLSTQFLYQTEKKYRQH